MSIITPGNESAHSSINLVTRRNNPIDNIQPWQHSHFEWSQLSEPLKRFTDKAFAIPLSGTFCPIYNCHGLTFGSRRTQVDFSNEAFDMILKDDGFVEVKQHEVQPGDVIAYYDHLGAVQHFWNRCGSDTEGCFKGLE